MTEEGEVARRSIERRIDDSGTKEAINTKYGLELVRERETYDNGW